MNTRLTEISKSTSDIDQINKRITNSLNDKLYWKLYNIVSNNKIQ